jgi:hypothetical protein
VGCFAGNGVEGRESRRVLFPERGLGGITCNFAGARALRSTIRGDQILADAWWLERIGMQQAMPCVEMHERNIIWAIRHSWV